MIDYNLILLVLCLFLYTLNTVIHLSERAFKVFKKRVKRKKRNDSESNSSNQSSELSNEIMTVIEKYFEKRLAK